MNNKIISKYLKIVAGYMLITACSVYVLYAAIDSADQIPVIHWIGLSHYLAIGSIAYLAQYISSGLGWHLLLRRTESKFTVSKAISMVMVSQFAKYVPGSIAQHFARVALARQSGVSSANAAGLLAIEISLTILTGSAIAFVAWALVGVSAIDETLSSVLVSLSIAAGLAAVGPALWIWLAGPRRPSAVDRYLGGRPLVKPSLTTMAVCVALYSFNFLICGIVIDFLAVSMFGAETSDIGLATGVFAAAWIAGFVTPMSPGGVGVREAVLLAGLTSSYGTGIALASALAFRMVSVIGDIVGFGLGHILSKGAWRRN